MQLRFGGSRCHAEHLGDLFVLVAFHVVQHEDAACSRRQLGDRFLEVEEVAGSERGYRRRPAARRFRPSSSSVSSNRDR